MNISRLFYKATGIMPKKEIARTCKNIGKDISNELNAGNSVTKVKVEFFHFYPLNFLFI